jgi:membrane protein required for colicin V production
MNPFDIVIVVVLGYCLVRGIFRGLVKELSSLVGVFAGFYGAYSYYDTLGRLLSRVVANVAYRNILSFLLIFVGVFVLVSIIGVLLRYVMSIVFLGWVDRICGALFGVFKGVLIVSVLLVAFTTFLPKNTPVIQDSRLAPHLSNISEQMSRVLSSDMKLEYGTKLKELRKRWQLGPA